MVATARGCWCCWRPPARGLAPLRFVSRDNPTGTARNLARFLGDAAIARSDVVLWNTVPWIVHAPGARNRAVRRGEIREGLALLPDLLRHLPALRVVLLAGRAAREAGPLVRQRCRDVTVLEMPHPSPTYVCTSPDVSQRIRAAITAAAMALRQGD